MRPGDKLSRSSSLTPWPGLGLEQLTENRQGNTAERVRINILKKNKELRDEINL